MHDVTENERGSRRPAAFPQTAKPPSSIPTERRNNSGGTPGGSKAVRLAWPLPQLPHIFLEEVQKLIPHPTMFTTVANCASLQQAHSLQIALDAAGIDSFIPDEISAGLTPHYFTTAAGVRLQVPEGNLEAARQIIREHQSPPDADARDGASL